METKRLSLLGLLTVTTLLLSPVRLPLAEAQASSIPDSPVFGLPFAEPPGPNTWYLSQFYGNTQSAYRWRTRYYKAGQGLHFGLDFAAQCGTEVIAIGDGEVLHIDDPRRGSGPHNLIIRHDNGLYSLYGHLLESPRLYVGQHVTQGEAVALSGDPDLTCTSRPHLHLEIRDFSVGEAYNPILLINADWDTLALFGTRSGFEADLKHPRRWMTPYDQPTVNFWDAMINNYEQPWPPDWN